MKQTNFPSAVFSKRFFSLFLFYIQILKKKSFSGGFIVANKTLRMEYLLNLSAMN